MCVLPCCCFSVLTPSTAQLACPGILIALWAMITPTWIMPVPCGDLVFAIHADMYLPIIPRTPIGLLWPPGRLAHKFVILLLWLLDL